MEWLDLFEVQGTLKSLLQHHNSKASALQHSASWWSNSYIKNHLRKGRCVGGRDLQRKGVRKRTGGWSGLWQAQEFILLTPWPELAIEPGGHSQRPQDSDWDVAEWTFFFLLFYSWWSGRNGTCLSLLQAQQNTAFIIWWCTCTAMQRHRNQCALIPKLGIHKLI